MPPVVVVDTMGPRRYERDRSLLQDGSAIIDISKIVYEQAVYYNMVLSEYACQHTGGSMSC